jgi:hypothetical protein
VEKSGSYNFKIYGDGLKRWYYKIFRDDGTVLRESQEIFLFEGIARFAAIGHIVLLEEQINQQ